jgi:hypothetical protein
MLNLIPWLTLFLFGASSVQAAEAPSIWFAPLSGKQGAPDFMDLFQPDAPWQTAASAISTFEISDELTYKHEVTDDQLRQLFSDLRRRKIDLAIGIAPLSGADGPGHCGYHVEGYGLTASFPAEVRRIKSLGADVRYFTMDEPLYFGHVFERDRDRFGCHQSIEQVAQDVATHLRMAREVYPSVRFGDGEPLSGFSKESWLAKFEAWFDAYRAATGEPLAFFRLDLAWDLDWRERIPAMTRLLRQKGIPLQVIYNGDDNLRDDDAWMASAVANFQAYESDGRAAPDAALIQYWMAHPSRTLPETDPRSATWLINRYVEWRQQRR